MLGLQLGDQVPALQVLLHFLWKKQHGEGTVHRSDQALGLLDLEQDGRVTMNLV